MYYLNKACVARNIKKKVGCLTFMPDERSILLGEKSGYVTCISIDGNNSELFQIDGEDAFLGHLSLLTDVVSRSKFSVAFTFLHF